MKRFLCGVALAPYFLVGMLAAVAADFLGAAAGCFDTIEERCRAAVDRALER